MIYWVYSGDVNVLNVAIYSHKKDLKVGYDSFIRIFFLSFLLLYFEEFSLHTTAKQLMKYSQVKTITIRSLKTEFNHCEWTKQSHRTVGISAKPSGARLCAREVLEARLKGGGCTFFVWMSRGLFFLFTFSRKNTALFLWSMSSILVENA